MLKVVRVVAVLAALALTLAAPAQRPLGIQRGRIGGPVSPVRPEQVGYGLGGGRALDRNLQAGSAGYNSPMGRLDFNAGNRLVTNNVVGGRGFRDTVGYGAVGDFSADEDDFEDGTGLGSNDLYPFLADSALSSVGALTLGGTYERVRYGQNLGLIDMERPGSTRLAGDYTGPQHEAPRNDVDLVSTFMRMQRDLTSDRLTVGQQLASRYEFSVEGNAIGYTTGRAEDGSTRYGIIRPDSLRGINTMAADQDLARFGLTAFDAAHIMDDVDAGLIDTEAPRRFEGRYDALDLESTRLSAPADEQGTGIGRVETGVESGRQSSDAYAEFRLIQAAVAERVAAMTPGVDVTDPLDMATIEAEIEELREMLAPHIAARNAAQGLDERTEAQKIMDPEGLIPDPTAAPELHVPEDGTPPGQFDEAVIERATRVLKHGQIIEHFAPETDKSRFGELMRGGEQYLREGKYFLAERRFQKAGRHAPGNPLVAAGLVHARIGAELYPGAAVELRSLLSERPEMIDTTYDPALAPAGQDLRRAIIDLRERVEAGTDPATLGILLAYVGRLAAEDDAIRTGLSAAEEANAADPMVPLLRRMWLNAP